MEHSLPRVLGHGNTIYEEGWHALTDGKTKYIWYSGSGREQLFDLTADRDETDDPVLTSGHDDALELWRSRLTEALKDRPEGFSDRAHLKPGCEHKAVMPGAADLMRQRISEGFDTTYVHYRSPAYRHNPLAAREQAAEEGTAEYLARSTCACALWLTTTTEVPLSARSGWPPRVRVRPPGPSPAPWVPYLR